MFLFFCTLQNFQYFLKSGNFKKLGNFLKMTSLSQISIWIMSLQRILVTNQNICQVVWIINFTKLHTSWNQTNYIWWDISKWFIWTFFSLTATCHHVSMYWAIIKTKLFSTHPIECLQPHLQWILWPAHSAKNHGTPWLSTSDSEKIQPLTKPATPQYNVHTWPTWLNGFQWAGNVGS